MVHYNLVRNGMVSNPVRGKCSDCLEKAIASWTFTAVVKLIKFAPTFDSPVYVYMNPTCVISYWKHQLHILIKEVSGLYPILTASWFKLCPCSGSAFLLATAAILSKLDKFSGLVWSSLNLFNKYLVINHTWRWWLGLLVHRYDIL